LPQWPLALFSIIGRLSTNGPMLHRFEFVPIHSDDTDLRIRATGLRPRAHDREVGHLIGSQPPIRADSTWQRGLELVMAETVPELRGRWGAQRIAAADVPRNSRR
jgi:hypothetical protein